MKWGAWTPCRECGYTPEDDESYTKHLLVSNHFLNAEELAAIAEQVKAGEAIEFPPELLQQAWVNKTGFDRMDRVFFFGCLTTLLAVIGFSIASVVRTLNQW